MYASVTSAGEEAGIGEDGGRAAYVAMTFGGVQEFIAAARRTSDLWAGSRILSHLSSVAAGAAGGRLVLPAAGADASSFPNRITVEVAAGTAVAAATDAVEAVRVTWAAMAHAVHGSKSSALEPVLATFPDVRWVAWEPQGDAESDFIHGWEAITEAATARKRVRCFHRHPGSGGHLCSSCGRFGASEVPARLQFRVRGGEKLCAVCAVKLDVDNLADRLGAARTRFPSTASIATEPFRTRVLDTLATTGSQRLADALDAHVAAVKRLGDTLLLMGLSRPPTDQDWAHLEGSWCYADSWSVDTILHEQKATGLDPHPLQTPCKYGRQALREVIAACKAETDDDLSPATYLAVLLQDGDDVGSGLDARLAAAPDPMTWLGDVSTALGAAAQAETNQIREGQGQAVFAGGDDVLALVPLATVLQVADQCRQAFSRYAGPFLGGATASSVVLCFHHSFPLQEAVRRAQATLKHIKQANPGKDRLAVVVVRRGGERAQADLPWQRGPRSAAESLTGLADAFRDSLSGRLIADIDAERHGLTELAMNGGAHRGELARLLQRHHGADALDLVLDVEPLGGIPTPSDVGTWVDALAVARFFAAEAR